jgi:hypothetical protein
VQSEARSIFMGGPRCGGIRCTRFAQVMPGCRLCLNAVILKPRIVAVATTRTPVRAGIFTGERRQARDRTICEAFADARPEPVPITHYLGQISGPSNKFDSRKRSEARARQRPTAHDHTCARKLGHDGNHRCNIHVSKQCSCNYFAVLFVMC